MKMPFISGFCSAHISALSFLPFFLETSICTDCLVLQSVCLPSSAQASLSLCLYLCLIYCLHFFLSHFTEHLRGKAKRISFKNTLSKYVINFQKTFFERP